MAKTKANLRTEIKLETRVKSSTNLDAFIDNVVDDILVDACNKTKYYELMKLDVIITLVTAQAQYALPADFQNLKELRYGVSPTPTNFVTLQSLTDNIRRSGTPGIPFFYFLSGTKVNVFPSSAIKDTDILYITYYADPLSVFTGDSDLFPIPRIYGMVKKRAIARVEAFHNNVSQAQMAGQEAGASFVSSISIGDSK